MRKKRQILSRIGNGIRITGLLVALFICTYSALGQSLYTLEVDIPEYDSLNSEHFLISTPEDWGRINDTTLRFFYVKPHENYGKKYILADGTEEKKRYISLHNGNDLHPAKLDRDQQANVSFIFSGAHWWVVDRMSSFDNSEEFCALVKRRSTNIVLNRMHYSEFHAAVGIKGYPTEPYTENITIQNCRMDPMSASGISNDAVAIIMIGEVWNEDGCVKNTRILNNEIRNCNDGIMPLRFPEQGHHVDYPGTLIDGNHIYIDTELYTDGSGNYNPNGPWALAENAIDLKAGSDDPDNPMVISNNYFWGYRRTDTNGGGSGSWGTALVGHFHVKNVIIENNVIFDSNRGISFNDPWGLPYAVENALIRDNIIYNIGFDTDGGIEFGQLFYDSKNVTFEKNTIVGVDKLSRWFSYDGSEENLKVSCNIVIDSHESTGLLSGTTKIGQNSFFNTTLQYSRDGTHYDNASDAHMGDLTFITDRFTNDPYEITLKGVVVTENTPHDAGCFPTSIEENSLRETEGMLGQNSPNPFYEETIISYDLPAAHHVEISVYDLNGTKLAELVNETKPAGYGQVVFHPENLPSGIYLYSIRTGSTTQVKRMCIIGQTKR